METAVTSAKVTYTPTGLNVKDTMSELAKGGSTFYSGGYYSGALRDLGAHNVFNRDLIPPSFTSNIQAQHLFRDEPKTLYSPTLVGNNMWVRTANNLYRFNVKEEMPYGLFVHSQDDRAMTHRSWRNATEMDRAVEYVKPREFVRFTIARNERLADAVVRKHVTDILAYDGPNNFFGTALSMSENIRQQLTRYSLSPEGIKLALEKSADGDISYIGVQSDKTAIYSINRLKNGKIAIWGGKEYFKHLSQEAKFFNVPVEDYIISVLGEEYMHIYRKSFDKNIFSIEQRIMEEAETKQELLNFYERLAEGAAGNEKLRMKYEKIITHIKHDLATISRYRKSDTSKSERGNRTENNRLVYQAEAIANGLEGKEIDAYVESRRREETEREFNEVEGLEKIVEESENPEFKEHENGAEAYGKGEFEAEYGREANESEAAEAEAEPAEASADSE